MMSDRPIVLSISMLVSGREEMFRSLESLRPLREALPCEVILVDTGCSREQRERAEKYADKIVDFSWRQDFAAARNAGLKEARGEWFLYLDDDEWFENPTEIIAFFQSGEYKSYHCASYVVRNYRDLEGSSYEPSYPLRLVERVPELRFVGKIHEYPCPIRPPKKVFNDFVHHYGYVFKSAEERDKHAMRNIAPLLEICREQPGDPRWSGQLAQEYYGQGKLEEVLEVCKKGLKEWRRRKDSLQYMPAHVGLHYAYILVCLERQDRYEEEEKWLKRAMEDELSALPVLAPTVAFYCLRGIILYRRLKKYELCSQYLEKYLAYARKYKDDRAAMESGTAALVSTVFEKQYLYGSVLAGLESVIRTENESLTEEILDTLNWQEPGLLGQEQWEKEILDAICSVPPCPAWKRLVQILLSRRGGLQELCPVLQQLEEEYESGGAEEKLARLRQLAGELEGVHPYLFEKKLLLILESRNSAAGKEAGELFARQLRQIFANHPELVLRLGDRVWQAAEDLGIDIEPMLLEADYTLWKRGAEEWCLQAELPELERWKDRVESWKGQQDIRYDLFDMKYRQGCLEKYEAAGLREQALGEKLTEWSRCVLAFSSPWLRPEALDIWPEALPEEILLARRLEELDRQVVKQAALGILEAARKCLGIYPPLEKPVGAYAEFLRDEVNRRQEEQVKAREELLEVVRTLKKMAADRIAGGEYQAAVEILKQILECVPEDEEAAAMLKRAENRQL